MAWGRRCDMGCESWPDEMIYQKCPLCGEATTRFANLQPKDPEDARSVLRHQAFERFYEEHCRKRGIPVEGPLPTQPEPQADIADALSEAALRDIKRPKDHA